MPASPRTSCLLQRVEPLHAIEDLQACSSTVLHAHKPVKARHACLTHAYVGGGTAKHSIPQLGSYTGIDQCMKGEAE